MTPQEAGRGIVAMLRKIPVVYAATAALIAVFSGGWFVRGKAEEQVGLPQLVSSLQAQMITNDSIVHARIDSTNSVLLAASSRLERIEEKQDITICFVRELWDGNARPRCGMGTIK